MTGKYVTSLPGVMTGAEDRRIAELAIAPVRL
jgi:hypothetical protein